MINGHLGILDLESKKCLIFFAPFRDLGHTKKIKRYDN
jgi:hypothetical protein